MQEALGTRVHIDRKEKGGQIKIDFFSNEDLHTILGLINSVESQGKNALMERFIKENTPDDSESIPDVVEEGEEQHEEEDMLEDRTVEEKQASDEEIDDLYNISNFSL